MESRITKNFIYNAGYQILTIIVPLITAPYITRVLGANNLGIYSKTQAFANYFFLFAMLGVNNYGNRAIARVRDDRNELSTIFWGIYYLQIATTAIASSVYLLLCCYEISGNQIIYLLQLFYVCSGFLDVNWFCFGIEKFRLTTIRSALIRIVNAALIFLLVRSAKDLWCYTLVQSFTYICSAFAVWPFVLKQVDFVPPSWHIIRKHIKGNLVLFWPVLAVSLYNIMDKLLLGYFSTNEEVAYYSNAERIVTIPTYIILALDNVVMPRMSNIFAKKDINKAKQLMSKVMLFAMFLSAAMAFGLAGISDVFAPWFYGEEFIRCGYFILLLSPTVLFKAWAAALRTQFIIPTGKDKIYIISLTAGATVNLILDVTLIPSMNGVGAIIGTLAAEFTVAFIQFAMCRKDIPLNVYLKNGLSFIVLGGVMFFCVKAVARMGLTAFPTLILQIGVGIVIYVILAFAYMIGTHQSVIVDKCLKILRFKDRF